MRSRSGLAFLDDQRDAPEAAEVEAGAVRAVHGAYRAGATAADIADAYSLDLAVVESVLAEAR
jgi:hypothetical protein